MVKTKKRTWWGFCLYLQRRACERTPSARVFCTYKKRTWWGFCLYLQRRACERAPSARVFVLLLFMPEIEFFNKFCIRLALFLNIGSNNTDQRPTLAARGVPPGGCCGPRVRLRVRYCEVHYY